MTSGRSGFEPQQRQQPLTHKFIHKQKIPRVELKSVTISWPSVAMHTIKIEKKSTQKWVARKNVCLCWLIDGLYFEFVIFTHFHQCEFWTSVLKCIKGKEIHHNCLPSKIKYFVIKCKRHLDDLKSGEKARTQCIYNYPSGTSTI